MNIGIDKMSFYTPAFYVDMVELAEARGIDPNKFTIGIGQDQMGFAPLSQDAVTMGANAALNMLSADEIAEIDLVIFASESGIDHSKAGAVYIHRLLGLPKNCRAIEFKEACYAATAGLSYARNHVAAHPTKKALVIGSDIARYGLNTPGEPTQGAGAVAMLVAAEPRLLVLNDDNVYLTDDIMDFWRPLYSETACVQGKYSTEQYIRFFNDVWEQYQANTKATLADFAALCFHLPYTKMGKKALDTIIETASPEKAKTLLAYYQLSTKYSRQIGNIYTGSLYLGVLSLLEHDDSLMSGDRLGLFSYGSGAVGEFFSATLAPDFRKQLYTTAHATQLRARKQLTIAEYEDLFVAILPTDGSTYQIDDSLDQAPIKLTGMSEHMRLYTNKSW